MSGTLALPASISITQEVVGPSITISQAGSIALPPGVPAYPLASDPGQAWSLQDVNGVLTWVEYALSPTQQVFALEDGAGVILLEDGAGVMLMEL